MADHDDDRFRDVYAARRGAVRATAYLLCGDWHHAEDLTQTAFVRLYLRWPKLQHHEAIDGYLRQTVVRLWIDETRRRRHRDLVVAVPPDTAQLDRDVTQRLQLMVALAAVPPRQRACLVLRFFNDLTVSETAEALGCSDGTVRSQTARGLDALRHLLDPALITPALTNLEREALT